MSAVGDITTAIKTRTAAVLGVSYKEAAYGIDFLKNHSKGSSQIYAVLPQNIQNVATVTRSVTYDQEWMIRIGNVYINQSMGDVNQQQVAIDSLEFAKDLFKDMVDTKCGIPGTCLNVTSLEVGDPIHPTESKMVIVEMSFIVKYRELI